jgi:alkane 1-monooxygenase
MISIIKYLIAYSTAIFFVLSIQTQCYYLPLIWMFGMIQLIDLFAKPSYQVISRTEELERQGNRIYDVLLWMVLPMQYGIVAIYLLTIRNAALSVMDQIFLTVSFGMCCAIYGINVAHELGHRTNAREQWMSKLLLLSTQYMHFFIEHNFGHHKNVGLESDGATARLGENVHTFVFRSIISGYRSAWKIETERLMRLGIPFWSIKNQMIVFTLLQASFLLSIFWFFHAYVLAMYLVGVSIGIFFLEATNYVQHYGLTRKKKENGEYEKVQLWHSWNSNYPMGRLILFELSRHSDHHDKATRKYQILQPHQDMPQLPTGYPGMILVSLFPPLFFKLMNPLVEAWKQNRMLSLASSE